MSKDQVLPPNYVLRRSAPSREVIVALNGPQDQVKVVTAFAAFTIRESESGGIIIENTNARVTIA